MEIDIKFNMDVIQQVISRKDTCDSDNEYNNADMGARISSIFAILVTSLFGVFLPILSSRYSFLKMHPAVFFVAKYFGSGVIIATAFIHLLVPANISLSNECLGGTFDEYPWAFGLALMSLFILSFCEILSFQMVRRKIAKESPGGHTSYSHFGDEEMYLLKGDNYDEHGQEEQHKQDDNKVDIYGCSDGSQVSFNTPASDMDKEQYYGQLISTFVLEFGIVFHSVFIGLGLAVSGEEFKTLYIVLIFHQMFEGLGLGTRIATTTWPVTKAWVPYVFGLCYGLTTPISIAIGLGVRYTYAPGSRTALITNGFFDAVCAGILIYSGLVELMAHEFLYTDKFKGEGGTKKMFLAYLILCAGCGIMALLGKWA